MSCLKSFIRMSCLKSYPKGGTDDILRATSNKGFGD